MKLLKKNNKDIVRKILEAAQKDKVDREYLEFMVLHDVYIKGKQPDALLLGEGDLRHRIILPANVGAINVPLISYDKKTDIYTVRGIDVGYYQNARIEFEDFKMVQKDAANWAVVPVYRR